MEVQAMLLVLIYIFFAHYVGDFIFQTTWMATTKSKSLKALFLHLATYNAVLLVFGFIFCWFTEVDIQLMAQYVLLNVALHLATDFVTSKCSSWAFENKKIELFWSMIGLDQFIHSATFIITLSYFIA